MGWPILKSILYRCYGWWRWLADHPFHSVWHDVNVAFIIFLRCNARAHSSGVTQ